MILRRHSGLSLVELLVAVAVFSVLGAIAYQGLISVANTSAALREDGDRLASLQFAVSLLERDLRQALPRPIRDQLGDRLPAMAGGNGQLQLTRSGWSNPIGQLRSDLERVGLQLDDGALVRFSWLVLDRSQRSQPRRQVLLDGVNDLRFRFLDRNLEWQNEWPPVRDQFESEEEPWPLAVSVRLETESFGSIERLLSLVSPAQPIQRSGGSNVGVEDNGT